MGRPLTAEELDAYLRKPYLCRIGTVRDDGWPYVVPVWHEYDGEALYIVPRARSRFVPYLRREPRVAVSFEEQEGRVLILGRAEIVEGPTTEGQWVDIAFRMAERYGGEAGLQYLRGTLDRPRYLVRIVPEEIISWTGGGWHPRYYEAQEGNQAK